MGLVKEQEGEPEVKDESPMSKKSTKKNKEAEKLMHDAEEFQAQLQDSLQEKTDVILELTADEQKQKKEKDEKKEQEHDGKTTPKSKEKMKKTKKHMLDSEELQAQLRDSLQEKTDVILKLTADVQETETEKDAKLSKKQTKTDDVSEKNEQEHDGEIAKNSKKKKKNKAWQLVDDRTELKSQPRMSVQEKTNKNSSPVKTDFPSAEEPSKAPRPGAQQVAGMNSSSSRASSVEQRGGDEGEVLVADAVTREDLEAQIRQEMLSTVVTAECIVQDDDGVSGKGNDNHDEKDNGVQSNKNEKRKKYLLCGGLLLVVILVVGILAGVLVGGKEKKDSNDEDGKQTSPEPGATVEEYFESLAPERDKNSNPGSPQAAAYQWMSDNGFLSKPYDDPLVLETYALVVLYHDAEGWNWKEQDNWLNGSISICDWYPFDLCDTATRQVVERFNLTDNNLKGHVPAEFYRYLCPNLRALSLPGNTFRQKFPIEMGGCSLLELLNMTGNEMDGNIFHHNGHKLARLTNLRVLELQDNLFDGQLEEEHLVRLSNLEIFNVAGNFLTGPLPSVLSEASNLEYLNLEGNQLTGTVPAQWDALTSLKYVNLAGNSLTGAVVKPVCRGMTEAAREDGEELEFIAECMNPSAPGQIRCFCCSVCCDNGTCVDNPELKGDESGASG